MPVAHQPPSACIGLRYLVPAAIRIQVQPRPPGAVSRMGGCGACQHEPSRIKGVDKELSAALAFPKALAMRTQQPRH